MRFGDLIWTGSVVTGIIACAETLPSDVANYREDDDCRRMNQELLPQRGDDPHKGEKNVYACNVPFDVLRSNQRPFPEGAIIIKESIRKDSDYAWLVATARKRADGWKWNEYSRNFEDEEFVHILPGEQVCIDCHKKVEPGDWIYTYYSRTDDEEPDAEDVDDAGERPLSEAGAASEADAGGG
jgi:hypothetical protein